MLVLSWRWVTGSLEAEQHDTVDDAVRSLWLAAEYGDCSPVGVEVWDDDGRYEFHEGDRLDALFRPLEQQERAVYASLPPTVAVIRIKGPDGRRSGVFAGYTSTDEAERRAEELRGSLGDRVTVEPVR